MDISATLTELAVEMSAELVDQTTMGNTYRLKAASLFTSRVTGKGLFNTTGMPTRLNQSFLWDQMGTDDVCVLLFADGITEGSTLMRGYAMRGVVGQMNFGGTIGEMLTLDFAIEHRGILGAV